MTLPVTLPDPPIGPLEGAVVAPFARDPVRVWVFRVHLVDVSDLFTVHVVRRAPPYSVASRAFASDRHDGPVVLVRWL